MAFKEIDVSSQEPDKRFLVFVLYDYEGEHQSGSFDSLEEAKDYILSKGRGYCELRVYDCDLRKDVFAGSWEC